jgi:hypothetical protein
MVKGRFVYNIFHVYIAAQTMPSLVYSTCVAFLYCLRLSFEKGTLVVLVLVFGVVVPLMAQ